MLSLTKLTWLVILIALCGLAACNGATPATDPSLAFTEIWETVAVAQTLTARFTSPTPSMTNTPLISPTLHATNTLLPTTTPLPGTPSVTPFKVSTPAGIQPAAIDNSIGVADVTYPDFAEVVAGADFIKTWRVKNLGPSTWNTDYRLIFGWGGVGTDWNTTPPAHLTATVLPGETIEISVELTAPTEAGTFAAAFRLQNDKAYNFGPEQTVVVTVK